MWIFWVELGFNVNINLTAFDDKTIISNAKFIIYFSSLIAGLVGFLFKNTLKVTDEKQRIKYLLI
jgi:NhaA family Na+:H+ antiporter